MPTIGVTLERPFSHTFTLLSLLLMGAWAGACGNEDEPVGATSAPPVTASPGTALHHAQTCAQKLGRIPSFACQDGVQIPILVDGEPVAATPDRCDNPDLKGECVVGSYVGRLPGENHDGSANPDVSWAFFCRRNDNFAQMIGYEKTTGATCFFELKNGAMPLEQGVPKGTVPSVDTPADYERAWKRPEGIVVGTCNHCHSPDPFIHTPYVDAARWTNDPTQPVVPQVASLNNPYYFVGDAFASWTLDYVEFDHNACTSCHRMPDFRRFTFSSGVDFNAHMPPLAPGTMKEDFDAVMSCLNEGPDVAPGCRWATLNGADPTTDHPTTKKNGKGSFQTTYGSLTAANPFTAGRGTFSGAPDFSFTKVGSVAGAAPAPPTGLVQLEVIGHQEIGDQVPQGIDYHARFLVPTASFTSGKVLASKDAGWSSQLLIVVDGSAAVELGTMATGTLTLVKAGVQPGDPVEGDFAITWQLHSDK